MRCKEKKKIPRNKNFKKLDNNICKFKMGLARSADDVFVTCLAIVRKVIDFFDGPASVKSIQVNQARAYICNNKQQQQ